MLVTMSGVGVLPVGVNPGVGEGVEVNAVDVGKGPSSPWAVSAMAVFVLLAFLWVSESGLSGFPNATV